VAASFAAIALSRSFDRRRVGGFLVFFGQGDPAGLAPVPFPGLFLAASSNKASPSRFGWNRRLHACPPRAHERPREWRYAMLVRAHDGRILRSAVRLLLVPTTGLGVAANSHPKPCNISWKRTSSFMPCTFGQVWPYYKPEVKIQNEDDSVMQLSTAERHDAQEANKRKLPAVV
jgi:hypothetical protein